MQQKTVNSCAQSYSRGSSARLCRCFGDWRPRGNETPAPEAVIGQLEYVTPRLWWELRDVTVAVCLFSQMHDNSTNYQQDFRLRISQSPQLCCMSYMVCKQNMVCHVYDENQQKWKFSLASHI